MRDEVRKIVGASYACNGKPALPGAWDLGGWCCEAKALEMYDVIQEASAHFGCPLQAVELGVFEGKSLFVQAHALKCSPHGGSVVGIDPCSVPACQEGFDLADRDQKAHVDWWSGLNLQNVEARCRGEIYARRLGQWCELRTAMPDDLASEYNALHWLHLDDSHSPVASLRNAQVWCPKVVPGGLIVVDDVHWRSMQPARRWIAANYEKVSKGSDEGMQWEFYRARAS